MFKDTYCRSRVLIHGKFKYIKREWKNGKWRYYYNDGKSELESGQKKGSRGDQVKAVQEVLKGMGYDLGKWGVDGIIGKKTEAAIKEFQKKNGLKVDGIIGQNTLAAFEKASQSLSADAKSTDTVKQTSTSSTKKTETDTKRNVSQEQMQTSIREAEKAISNAQTWLKDLL